MASGPSISILLPALDAERTLASCLRSIQGQTLSTWECVIVDDGSTDATPRIAGTFATRDPRVRLISADHAGLVASLNAGLGHCRAPLIARMDADDLMHPLRLAGQAELLAARPDWTAVGCHVHLFPRHRLRHGDLRYEQWLNRIDGPDTLRREAFVECPLAHPSLMARRDPLVRAGYRAAGWPEDYDLILRWLTEGKTIGVLPQPRLWWRHGPGRLSRRSDVYADDSFTRCKAEFLARSFLASTSRFGLWGYGGTGRALRRALSRHGKQLAFVIDLDPGRRGNTIDGAPVFGPDELDQPPSAPLIVSVSGSGPRGRIRTALSAAGLRESVDFVCAA